jgi:hypothetical protein
MSNYLCTITFYQEGLVGRTIQMHLKDVRITDNPSARSAVEAQIEKDGFNLSDRERARYVITMLCKIDKEAKDAK